MAYLLCCEGPTCNHGLSAQDRFTRHYGRPNGVISVHDTDLGPLMDAHQKTTHALAVTRHETVNTSGTFAKCSVCGHVRRYGSAPWSE